MFLVWLLFLAALSLEGIGTYISVIGLSAAFAADPIILTMAVVLDFCKIIAVSTLAKRWKQINTAIKGYLIAATMVLMIITSSGIAGYLSNSFQKAILPNQGNTIVLDNLNKEHDRLAERKKEIDAQISQLPANNVKGRKQLMLGFKPETDHINQRLNEIDVQLPTLQTKEVTQNTEVGPIIFLAQLMNTTAAKAVSLVIAMIIFVFDPLSIVFLITGSRLLNFRDEEKKKKTEEALAGKTVIDNNEVESVKYIDPEPDNPIEAVEETIHEPFTLEPLPEIVADAEILTEPTIVVSQEPCVNYPSIDGYDPLSDKTDFFFANKSDQVTEEVLPTIEPQPEIEFNKVEKAPLPIIEVQDIPTDLTTFDESAKAIEDAAFEEAALGIAPEPIVEVIPEPTAKIVQAEPRLEDILKEILVNSSSSGLTEEERTRIDKALDKILHPEAPQKAPEEHEDVVVEESAPEPEPLPEVSPVIVSVDVDPTPEFTNSLLFDPLLNNIAGANHEFVGPHWINPKLLEIYSDNPQQ